MAEIGVLEGYKHKEDVPDFEYLKLAFNSLCRITIGIIDCF